MKLSSITQLKIGGLGVGSAPPPMPASHRRQQEVRAMLQERQDRDSFLEDYPPCGLLVSASAGGDNDSDYNGSAEDSGDGGDDGPWPQGERQRGAQAQVAGHPEHGHRQRDQRHREQQSARRAPQAHGPGINRCGSACAPHDQGNGDGPGRASSPQG